MELDGLEIDLSYTDPSGLELKRVTMSNASGNFSDNVFELNQIGNWQIVATFDETGFQPVSETVSVEVIKGTSELIFYEMIDVAKVGETHSISGRLKPMIAAQISVRVQKPGESDTVKDPLTTDEFGGFSFDQKFDKPDEWLITLIWDGNDNYEGVRYVITVAAEQQIGKAIIVLGGGDEENNENFELFNKNVEQVYKTLHKRKYSDDDIWFLSPSLFSDCPIDAKATKNNLRSAITKWAKEQVSANSPLLLYLISHNTDDKFLLEKTASENVRLHAEELDSWLDQISDDVQITVIIEACYSGNFVEKIAGKNRVILTSADEINKAVITRSSSFTIQLMKKIVDNKPLEEAFETVKDWMSKMTPHKEQHPRIEADGNGIANERDDLFAVKELYIPANFISLEDELPDIFSVQATSETINVRLTEAAQVTVSAMFIPPYFDPNAAGEQWQLFDVLILESVDDLTYEVTHEKFDCDGKWSIMLTVENEQGEISTPIQKIVSVGVLEGDVDGNGKVDIFDLVTVGSQFGQAGDGLSGDVNGDGKVDIFDLVMVGSHFGESVNAAPSRPQNLDDLILTLEAMPDRPEGAEAALRELREILRHDNSVILNGVKNLILNEVENLILNEVKNLIPDQTRLLPNYPNPFNPETWIPFDLAENANVSIEIYDVNGGLIRRLDLGHQKAGSYRSREKAVHWDGRDASGEQVASGIYFVQMKAGTFVQTRRLVVLK